MTSAAESAASLEAGRLLFAKRCEFWLAVADADGLPANIMPEIAFIGRSNVGKSSLVNALTGQKALARSSNTPGRTQELIFFNLGDALTLVDMPGYGYAAAPKAKAAAWTILARKYLRGRANLMRALVLIDARHGVKPNDVETMKALDASAVSYAIVLTKIDEVKAADRAAREEATLEALRKRAAAYPRVFATSTGYLRYGSQLDLYHFAVIDLVNNAYPTGSHLTNLSAGANFKPSPRLRLTASFNRVDTETLNVQANAFLNPGALPTPTTAVDNETFIKRLSTNALRAGVSAGLGELQRFELSASATYRYRPALQLTSADNTTTYKLDAGQGVDLYASITDRRSIKDLRLGFDISRSFAIGTVAFQRSEVLAVRVSGSRELASGKGEWEAELSDATTKDKSAGIDCADPGRCYGASTGSIFSLGGNLYYRINRDWFTIASLFLSRQSLVHTDGTTMTTDPTITGLTGFFRIGYRF